MSLSHVQGAGTNTWTCIKRGRQERVAILSGTMAPTLALLNIGYKTSDARIKFFSIAKLTGSCSLKSLSTKCLNIKMLHLRGKVAVRKGS